VLDTDSDELKKAAISWLQIHDEPAEKLVLIPSKNYEPENILTEIINFLRAQTNCSLLLLS